MLLLFSCFTEEKMEAWRSSRVTSTGLGSWGCGARFQGAGRFKPAEPLTTLSPSPSLPHMLLPTHQDVCPCYSGFSGLEMDVFESGHCKAVKRLLLWGSLYGDLMASIFLLCIGISLVLPGKQDLRRESSRQCRLLCPAWSLCKRMAPHCSIPCWIWCWCQLQCPGWNQVSGMSCWWLGSSSQGCRETPRGKMAKSFEIES